MSEDHLSNEVSIEAKIEGKGIAAKIKSRFLSATDRLLGGAVDIPAAYFENIARRMRKKGDVELKMIEAEGVAAVEKLTDDPEFGAIIAGEYTKAEIRKIENKSKIVKASLEYIKADEKNGTDEDQNQEIDDDWLNYFENYAEKASTERMQDLWARVLAGEVRKPATFSLTTLRFIPELDQEIAETFQEKTRFASSSGNIIAPEKLAGEELKALTFLEEAGLVSHVAGGIGQTLKPDDEGKILIREQNLVLMMETTVDVRVPIIRLSRTGREIMSILPPTDPKLHLKSYFNACDEKVTSASLHKITEELQDGRVGFQEALEVWKKPLTAQTS